MFGGFGASGGGGGRVRHGDRRRRNVEGAKSLGQFFDVEGELMRVVGVQKDGIVFGRCAVVTALGFFLRYGVFEAVDGGGNGVYDV